MLLVLEIDANIQDLSTYDIFPKVLFKPQSHSSHTVGLSAFHGSACRMTLSFNLYLHMFMLHT